MKKQQGGLGIKDVSIINKVLLGKWSLDNLVKEVVFLKVGYYWETWDERGRLEFL